MDTLHIIAIYSTTKDADKNQNGSFNTSNTKIFKIQGSNNHPSN